MKDVVEIAKEVGRTQPTHDSDLRENTQHQDLVVGGPEFFDKCFVASFLCRKSSRASCTAIVVYAAAAAVATR